MGMCLSVFEFKRYSKGIASEIAGIAFIALSVAAHLTGIENGFMEFGLGVLACFSVIGVVMNGSKQSWWLSLYTMPIFLMHTLFAAPLRTLLFKLGIQNAVIHVVLGIGISFIGPIVTGVIMKKMKWPEVFLYPGKFIK